MELLPDFNATTLLGVALPVPATSGDGAQGVTAVLDADGTWISSPAGLAHVKALMGA